VMPEATSVVCPNCNAKKGEWCNHSHFGDGDTAPVRWLIHRDRKALAKRKA